MTSRTAADDLVIGMTMRPGSAGGSGGAAYQELRSRSPARPPASAQRSTPSRAAASSPEESARLPRQRPLTLGLACAPSRVFGRPSREIIPGCGSAVAPACAARSTPAGELGDGMLLAFFGTFISNVEMMCKKTRAGHRRALCQFPLSTRACARSFERSRREYACTVAVVLEVTGEGELLQNPTLEAR